MRCPICGFEGEFNKVRPRFLVFNALDSLIESSRARRSSVCPHCGAMVTLPWKSGPMTTVVLFLVVMGLAVGVAMFLWDQLH